MIATLGTFFHPLGPANLELVPNPVTAPNNNLVTTSLAGSIGALGPGRGVPDGRDPAARMVPAARRTAYVRIPARGGRRPTNATAFSAGMNVNAVRISAYALGGTIAAVGGIALAGLVQFRPTRRYSPTTSWWRSRRWRSAARTARRRPAGRPARLAVRRREHLPAGEPPDHELHTSAYFLIRSPRWRAVRRRAARRAHLQSRGAGDVSLAGARLEQAGEPRTGRDPAPRRESRRCVACCALRRPSSSYR